MTTLVKMRDYSQLKSAIVQLRTPEDFPIKNYKKNFGSIGFDILSYSNRSPSLATASIRKDELDNLQHRIRQYADLGNHPGKSYFSPLEGLSGVPPEEKIEEDIDVQADEKLNVLISFYDILAQREREGVLSDLRSLVSERGGTFVAERTFSSDITIAEIIVAQTILPELCQYYSTIHQIVRNRSVFVGQSITVGPIHNPISIEGPASDAVVGIVDSGVNELSPALQGLVAGRLQYLPNASTERHLDHGTFVASRCIYGDSIETSATSDRLSAQCKVYDISVFGKKANGDVECPDMMALMSAIDDVVQRLHTTVKVYNLSMGVEAPISTARYSVIAKLIDALSRKYDVLFVISAGNIMRLLGPYPNAHFSSPLSAILPPAESLLAVTVGSIAKHAESGSLSVVNEVSPFSRRGPGHDTGLKPEVVAHGGNLDSRFRPSPRTSAYGLSQDGFHLAFDIGTSHSAPIVAQYAARLIDAYRPQRVTLAKALLCHFAEERSIPPGLPIQKEDLVGLGEPNLTQALYESANRASYLYEGTTEPNHYQYVTFHVPKALAVGTSSVLRIHVTVVYDPPVNPTNEVEYSGARLAVAILKPTKRGFAPVASDDARKCNVPWNPVVHLEKSFARGYNAGPWQLRLRLYTRGKIPDDFVQSYSAVIEVIDESGTVPVYDEILAQYGAVYRPIMLRFVA